MGSAPLLLLLCFIQMLLLFLAIPQVAQALPPEIERQIQAGHLSRQEALLLYPPGPTFKPAPQPKTSGTRQERTKLNAYPPAPPSPPRPMGGIPLSYPEIAQRNGWQGRVVVRAYVSADGIVEDTQIATSSGYPVLDAEAAETVRKVVFQPAMQGGQATGAWVKIPITFAL